VLKDLLDPVDPQDAATKNYVDTTTVASAGDTMTGPLAMSGQKITGLGDPTNAQDAVTKTWVETAGASPLVQFRSIFYGAFATDQATDPYGGAPTEGDLYFNSTLDQMRVYNGTSWQEASADATITRFKFTAAGGETSLSGNDDDSQSLTYNVGLEMVYINGALMTRGVDYVATTGSSITGLAALSASDLVEVVAFSQIDAIGSIPSANSTFLQSGTGAVQRTVDSKLKDVVSVKDFGAVGDGVADDRARFALADSSAPAGAALYIPPGTYRLDGAALTINRKVVAYGATFTGTCQLSMPLMETSSSNVNRLGSYAAVGTPVDFGGGKGGVLVGGGNPRSTNGTYLSCDGATNWLSVLPSKNYNPQELIIYGSAAQGYATTVNGTNQITKAWGSNFDSAWIGRTIYFLRKKFKVATVPSTSSLTVTELGGGSVTFPGTETEAYNFFYTSGSGTCNVSGTTVTFVSGDPFVPLFFTDFEFRLNGVLYTVASFDSVTQYTLSTAPGNGTSIPFTWSGNINDQLTTLRVQAIQGENEENVNLLCRAGDNFLGRYYGLEAGFAGAYGTFRPIYMGSGSYTDFSYQHQIGLYPRNYLGSGAQGYVSLGGVQGREGFRVYSPNASTVLANRLSTQGAATTFAPAIRAEGSDTNIGLGLDAKGAGDVTFTQDFTRTLLKITGGASTVNFLETVASATTFSPALRAKGSDSNLNIGLDTKGTGNITITQDFSRTLLRVFGVASAVNHPTISNSATGNPVEFAVASSSSDTDVDIRLIPKGAGVVRFGTHTATADTAISGYVTIKDGSGNTRKLAVIT
jgi:hypothetical protein